MKEIPSATQRVLDAAERKGVKLEVTFFDKSTHTAADAARAVGAEIGQIVKSLVFVSEEVDGLQPFLVLASGANTVDLSLLAAILTTPRIRRATAEEARELTGFSIGGIPPFGHRQQIKTVMDPDLTRYETIWAAAGTSNTVFPTGAQHAAHPHRCRRDSDLGLVAVSSSSPRRSRAGRRRVPVTHTSPAIGGDVNSKWPTNPPSRSRPPTPTRNRTTLSPVPGWAGRALSMGGSGRPTRYSASPRAQEH